jgi:hypothetical protein
MLFHYATLFRFCVGIRFDCCLTTVQVSADELYLKGGFANNVFIAINEAGDI